MRYQRSLAIASRHDKLIGLIRAGEFSSSDLAQELHVSEQTIYRDIESLKERGYSIQSVRLAKGWAYKFLGEPVPVPAGKGG